MLFKKLEKGLKDMGRHLQIKSIYIFIRKLDYAILFLKTKE